MILLYFLSFYAGSVAQDLWYLPGPDEKKGITFDENGEICKIILTRRQ